MTTEGLPGNQHKSQPARASPEPVSLPACNSESPGRRVEAAVAAAEALRVRGPALGPLTAASTTPAAAASAALLGQWLLQELHELKLLLRALGVLQLRLLLVLERLELVPPELPQSALLGLQRQ